jgi:dolichol-phosphate mannosyltransferase
MTDAWVILPTYNERENLPIVLAGIREALAGCRPSVQGTVLVVDDASPDGTGELADQLARGHADVQVLHRTRKDGLGGAYLAGFARALAAGAQLIIEMDADLSHDPADLPRLIAAARGGADVVAGSRYLPGGGVTGWPLRRRLLSRGGGRYAAAVLGLPLTDLTSGFKCFRASVLRSAAAGGVGSRGYAFQIELTYRAARGGFHVAEIPIVFRERERGCSKMSLGIAMEAMWRVPLLRLSARLPEGRRRPARRLSGDGLAG